MSASLTRMNSTPDGSTPHTPALSHGSMPPVDTDSASTLPTESAPALDSGPAPAASPTPAHAVDEAAAATLTPQETTGSLDPHCAAEPTAQEATVGLGPWPGGRDAWPSGDHYDPELLEHGDRRNVEDHYRYWTMDAIRADIAQRTLPFEVAIENLGHDFNIGSIVRTANALGARTVHIVGRKRWNRRGAMVTERYMDVRHHDTVDAFFTDVGARGLDVIGIDNTPGSRPIEKDPLDGHAVLVFGEESQGLSAHMRASCSRVLHITQRGSTRSMNVGHAAAIAMWAWVRANG